VKCPEPGCTGEIDADGYCTVTGMKVSTLADSGAVTTPVPGAPSAPSGTSSPSVTTGTRAGVSRRTTAKTTSSPRSRLGAGLIDIPPIPDHDPASAVLSDPVVAEHKRFCAVCDEPVGRSRDDTPGRTEGFCSKCGHPFSFTPKLGPGDVVGARYEVVGCLAHGGLGWIYLARDLLLEQRWVVLKGLVNTGDADALAAAVSERKFLATVEHNDIVKIFDVAEHGSDAYIVMEYVRGKSLRGLLEEWRAEHDGEPLPVAHAIAYMLEILPALGYLHRRGLVFCDFKPDNVMQTGTSLKLIDLGGVYRMDDDTSPIYGTRGYQAPEIADMGPTVPSDLFTVGRTLAVLCTNFRGYQSKYEYSLPSPEEVPLYATFESLYKFLQRATAPDPAERFQSADEMADQLFGVLREVVAYEKGTGRAAPSTLFTTELRGALDRADWRTLPALLVSADDAASGYLATLAATAVAPDELVENLEHAPVRTVEVDLRHARALIDAGRPDDADVVLAAIESEDSWEWRVPWYRGLLRLSRGEAAAAIEEFAIVYNTVPGEMAAKLGLAYALEGADRDEQAERLYNVVSRTDPSFTSAAFGLARVRAALGNSDGAVDAYDRVPEESSAYVDAQMAKAERMLQRDGQLALADVIAAGAIVDRLPADSEARARLTADVLTAALPLAASGGGTSPTIVLGYPLTENGIRSGLEDTFRLLARRARVGTDRIELVDRANQVRPRTLV